jgi:hypothetical protein
MSSYQRPSVTFYDLEVWCKAKFGTPVKEILFEAGYSSAVFGLLLPDDRRVVVKIRPWSNRRQPCYEVHRFLWERGFPCPEPLGPPQRHSGLAVSFENYLPDGENLSRGASAAAALGRVLAELVRMTPLANTVSGLEPDYGFMRWNELGDGWPSTTDIQEDLNSITEPAWIERCAALVRPRLRDSVLPALIGHGDWWSENVRWKDGKLYAVDDWDSIVCMPEPAIAGVAAALFADGQSTVAESAIFLDTYMDASAGNWTQAETQMAWAAGLWARLFDARKLTLQGVSGFADALKPEVQERLDRAGIRFSMSGWLFR